MTVPKDVALPHFNAVFIQVSTMLASRPSTMKRSFAHTALKNNQESDSQDPIQALQGVPYAIRKVIGIAKIKIHIIVEPVDPGNAASTFRFKLTSSVMGLGIIGAAPLKAIGFQTDNTDVRVMDGVEVEKDEPMIGKTKSRIWMCTLEELMNEPSSMGEVHDFLKQGWEGCSANETRVVRISVKSASSAEPWQNEQVWGTQGGRWTARVAFKKGNVNETARILYDHVA
ncbi:hypothetical protein F53441_12189 [Fusarium austroafricanum]|uniref:Uncharacterized protein n=1 Tax=Fusarium austroafricanum TaxID=2364996 RepID=A0A8H4JZQ6_9HYPO|nr:hypothetical protein F53441_12189 [Fusarium austroafricanum]